MGGWVMGDWVMGDWVMGYGLWVMRKGYNPFLRILP